MAQKSHRIQRCLQWLPVVMLIVVATHQQYRAHTQDLTAWKGGGFGMFSTVDELHRRMVFVHLETDAGSVPIAADAYQHNFNRLYRKTAALPHGPHAQQLADTLAQRDWYAVTDHNGQTSYILADHASPLPATAEPVPFKSLRLEVWRLNFSSENNLLSRHMLALHQAEAQP